jgi:aspartate/methionine/tyrosine aminotransferase
MFSSRTPGELQTNRLTRLLAEKQSAGESVLDLTESNPTRAGFIYPEKAILTALANPRALLYEPDPKGLLAARQAIIAYYQERGMKIDSRQLFLTASTSEAYTLLFKLLMSPGDNVLTPAPSYPLFDHLARVESVQPISYPLYFDGSWHINFLALRAACDQRTRAIIIVNPNNPTGSFLKKAELIQLIEICQEKNLALISDEVFTDYALIDDSDRVSSIATTAETLCFALNGLSKAAGLPQLKLGWIVVNGQGERYAEALERLEFITDLFLSVSSPVQHALPDLLKLAPDIQRQIIARVQANRSWLLEQLPRHSASRWLAAEGGWYAILQVPNIIPEEELALELLAKDNLLLHPGYFFDFATEAFLVISLITKPEILRAGAGRLLARINSMLC